MGWPIWRTRRSTRRPSRCIRKSAELAPEAVATIKAIGPKGGEIEQRAIVAGEKDLTVPDPDQLTSGRLCT